MKFSPYNVLKVYIFLMMLPYLYPQHYFIYTKVYSIPTHLILCLLIYFTGYIAINWGFLSAKSLKPQLFSTLSRPTPFLYSASKLMILISCIANCFIALYVYFIGGLSKAGSEFDLVAVKNQEHGFVGFTFLSQVYLFFIPYFIAYSIKKKYTWKRHIYAIIICVLIRSIFHTERLAIIELAIFLLVTLEYQRIVILTYKKILLSAVVFILFFIGGEITRQFYAQYVLTSLRGEIDWGFALGWSLERYAAYYSDTTNKFYLILRDDLFYLNHFYLQPFGQILSKFNILVNSDNFNLQNYGLRKATVFQDFTNVSGLSALFLDFGYFGLIEFFFIFYSFGFLYSYYIRGRDLVIHSIYPAFVIGGLEFARIIYFYDTRILIPLFIFIAVLIINRFKKRNISR